METQVVLQFRGDDDYREDLRKQGFVEFRKWVRAEERTDIVQRPISESVLWDLVLIKELREAKG